MTKYFLTAVLVALTFGCTTTSARPLKSLVLKQQSDCYGNITSTVSSGALKICLDGRRVYLVAMAPTWRVMLCNDESKTTLAMPLAAWLEHRPQFNYMGADWNRYAVSVSPVSEGKLAGLPCKNYVFPSATKKLAECEKGPNKYHGLYAVLAPLAGGVDLSQGPVCSIVEKALSCPKLDGMPVNLTATAKKTKVEGYKLNFGGESHWLATTRIEVRDVDDKFFAYPVGYKNCPREVDVLKDEKHDAVVKSMFDDLIK